MEEKKSFGEKLGAFFAGKGFYIVLLLSAAVIGTSIWLINAERSAMQEEAEKPAVQVNREDLMPRRVETVPEADTAKERKENNSVKTEKPDLSETVPAMKTENALPTAKEAVFVLPVEGEIARAYSMDALTYDRTMADWRTHSGCDYAAAPGAPVMAVTDGTVSAVYTDDMLGTVVEIDHGGGLVSVYGNLDESVTVAGGQQVSAGETIGTVGATALAEIGEESHLHFAMRLNGENADPARWLPTE